MKCRKWEIWTILLINTYFNNWNEDEDEQSKELSFKNKNNVLTFSEKEHEGRLVVLYISP